MATGSSHYVTGHDRQPPPLKKKYYLLESYETPEDVWKSCVNALDDWEKDKAIHKDSMDRYKKERALNMVWVAGKLKGSVPNDDKHTFTVLGEMYDAVDPSPANQPEKITDADKDRESLQQLTQHMQALKMLCFGNDIKAALTVDLIKRVHGVLMRGVSDKSGDCIPAGEFRQVSVHVGDHIFPSCSAIPNGMEKIVKEFNDKFSEDHDIYALACWLMYKFVTLHPFQDGNGRMCRLLWCYSLMKDGLPFPLTISSGHTRAYKHYVQAIEADRRSTKSPEELPQLTTLTVLAVSNAWKNFYDNLEFEKK